MMEIDKKKNMVYGQQKEAASKLSPEVEAKMNELSPKAFTKQTRRLRPTENR